MLDSQSTSTKIPPHPHPSLAWMSCGPYFGQNWILKWRFDQLLVQRWANSVLMTEYEHEYYSVSQKWPNTNTNIIRFPKNDRIRIRILFDLPKITEYEYEYYSVTQKWPNTEYSKKNTHPLIFQRIGWSGHLKSESVVTNFHVPIYQGFGPTYQRYQCSAKYL